MTNNALFTEHHNQEMLIMCVRQVVRLQGVFETLFDSVVAVLGAKKP